MLIKGNADLCQSYSGTLHTLHILHLRPLKKPAMTPAGKVLRQDIESMQLRAAALGYLSDTWDGQATTGTSAHHYPPIGAAGGSSGRRNTPDRLCLQKLNAILTWWPVLAYPRMSRMMGGMSAILPCPGIYLLESIWFRGEPDRVHGRLYDAPISRLGFQER